jgi:GntR family transcriptional regulator
LRRKEFAEQYIDPLLTEARRLGITTDELVDLVRQPGRASAQHHSTTQEGQAS